VILATPISAPDSRPSKSNEGRKPQENKGSGLFCCPMASSWDHWNPWDNCRTSCQ